MYNISKNSVPIGKDRTGMVVTFEQSRQLSERYGLVKSDNIDGILRIANLMRVYGSRIMVAEKNTGRKGVYSINKLQAQFFPSIYKPPSQCCEDLLKRDLS